MTRCIKQETNDSAADPDDEYLKPVQKTAVEY